MDTFPQFKSHLIHHEDEKVFNCSIENCDQEFKDIESYLSHRQTIHRIQPISNAQDLSHLSNSNSIFPPNTSLGFVGEGQKTCKTIGNISYETKRRKRQKLVCVECKIKFSSQNSYDKHMRLITHDVKHQIDTSDLAINFDISRTKLKDETRKKVTCNICGKEFKSEFYLKSHKLIHTGDLPFGCDKCSARFNRRDKLKRHALIHEDNKRYQCPFRENGKCKKEFHRLDKLQSHIKTHGNTKQIAQNDYVEKREKLIKCLYCEETFKIEKMRRMHHENIHGITLTIEDLSNTDYHLTNKINSQSNVHKIDSSQQGNIIVYLEPE